MQAFRGAQLKMEIKWRRVKMNATSWMGLLTISAERSAEPHQRLSDRPITASPPPLVDVREASRSLGGVTYRLSRGDD